MVILYSGAPAASEQPTLTLSDSEEEIDFGFWEKAPVPSANSAALPTVQANKHDSTQDGDLGLLWERLVYIARKHITAHKMMGTWTGIIKAMLSCMYVSPSIIHIILFSSMNSAIYYYYCFNLVAGKGDFPLFLTFSGLYFFGKGY